MHLLPFFTLLLYQALNSQMHRPICRASLSSPVWRFILALFCVNKLPYGSSVITLTRRLAGLLRNLLSISSMSKTCISLLQSQRPNVVTTQPHIERKQGPEIDHWSQFVTGWIMNGRILPLFRCLRGEHWDNLPLPLLHALPIVPKLLFLCQLMFSHCMFYHLDLPSSEVCLE